MPRLVNTKSGAIVSVTEEKATRLGGEWEPVKSTPEKKTTAKKSASSSKTEK